MTITQWAVDIGNTSAKICQIAGVEDSSGTPLLNTPFRLPSDSIDLDTANGDSDQARLWYVASVKREAERELASTIRKRRPQDSYQQLSLADIPLTVNVDRPENVGIDRLLAATAAHRLGNDGFGTIIVNSGTAITIDFLTADGTYQGGAILPGFSMSAQAMFSGTDALPDIREILSSDFPAPVGKSTEHAIKSGLLWGGVGAVERIVAELKEQSSESVEVFISGGDASVIAKQLRAEAIHVEELVLLGIAYVATT